MSVLEDILENIGKFINNSNERWKNVFIVYNEHLITPQTELPAIVIQPEGLLINNNLGCFDQETIIKLMLYLSEPDKINVIRTAWNFQEDVLKRFKEPSQVLSIHENIVSMEYDSVEEVKTLMLQKKGAGEYTFLADVVTINFKLKYTI